MSIGEQPTLTGYRFDEVLSSLQKMIRQSDEEKAMYWAIELERSFAPHLWNRLEIISHEDVGIHDLTLIPFIRTCKEQYFEMKKRKNDANRMVLSNAILAMCRSRKTRLADNFCIQTYRRAESEILEIPDVAKDKHTKAGRQMGRGFEHFFDEGVKLVPSEYEGWELQGDDPYKQKAREKTENNFPPMIDVSPRNDGQRDVVEQTELPF